MKIPSREELAVAKSYLIDKKSDPEKEDWSILQLLHPVKTAFPDAYRFYEAIETFGATTTVNESSFSALSRIDTVRRSTMTDQRLCNLSFLGFEKDRLKSLNVDTILRKFSEKNRKIQLFLCE